MTNARVVPVVAIVCLLGVTEGHTSMMARGTCESLTTLRIPNTTITMATVVSSGAVVTTNVTARHAFCRVAATLTPSSDSDIKIEVWLPASGWNHKLMAVGNGAFNGTINYTAMQTAMERGYAATSTDTGHSGGGAEWALGHPEKVIDFGWRAVHEMTVVAKKVVASYYESDAQRAYWNGCSAGGRQAMKSAHHYPFEFDGIIAGAPGLDWTGRAAQAVRVAKPLETSEAARLLAPQRQFLHQAVVEQCDALDGVKDGLIEDPQRCRFDPRALQCADAPRGTEKISGIDCLTEAQVETARLIYSSPVNPKSQRPITGLAYGSELGWTDLGWTASARATGLDQFRYIVFQNPAWTVQQFNFDSDIVRAEEVDNGTINALDAVLQPLIAHGGKLIQYHGWSDPQISPNNSTQYYAEAVKALGGEDKVQTGYRLFMVPGMGHCGGGEGPNTFDMVSALEDWVERGKARDRITASHSINGAVDRTRPLCPYPQVAVYKGSGSIDDASSFSCVRQRVQ
jgi:feruloyl esterase